jgi:Type II secretion system (T2SS), protein E, N-terminal domain
MNSQRRDVPDRSFMPSNTPQVERCHCLPLSSLQAVHPQAQDEESVDIEKITPATPALNAMLRAQLASFFPSSTSLSLLLLHISQLEHISLSQPTTFNKRQRYHAPPSFLEQVLANVRRAIRSSEQILVDEGVGAAIIFPDVDQQGISKILERIYQSVSLLQAETVIPPLKHETDVVIGIGSYPEAGGSLEHLLHHVSVTTRRFTLPPAITTQTWDIATMQPDTEELIIVRAPDSHGNASSISPGVPFMQLPSQLPARLKHLIPYDIALQLRCAPVGRDHHCLTVAMAEPSNSASIQYLAEITGLTIFPVSCDISMLNTLLANQW